MANKSTTAGDYTIDHEGPDGRWRAWWLRPDGYTEGREFGSRREAVRWARYMTALEAEAAGAASAFRALPGVVG